MNCFHGRSILPRVQANRIDRRIKFTMQAGSINDTSTSPASAGGAGAHAMTPAVVVNDPKQAESWQHAGEERPKGVPSGGTADPSQQSSRQ